MADLKEKEKQLRLYLQTIEEQIRKFESIKSILQEREDEIRAEITTHSFSPTPISLKPQEHYKGDVYAEVQKHLLELNKLKNYISIKLKELIREEELLTLLKGKFGEGIDFEKPSRGEFEIVYCDQQVKDAFESLKQGREQAAMIKDYLSEMNEKEETTKAK